MDDLHIPYLNYHFWEQQGIPSSSRRAVFEIGECRRTEIIRLVGNNPQCFWPGIIAPQPSLERRQVTEVKSPLTQAIWFAD